MRRFQLKSHFLFLFNSHVKTDFHYTVFNFPLLSVPHSIRSISSLPELISDDSPIPSFKPVIPDNVPPFHGTQETSSELPDIVSSRLDPDQKLPEASEFSETHNLEHKQKQKTIRRSSPRSSDHKKILSNYGLGNLYSYMLRPGVRSGTSEDLRETLLFFEEDLKMTREELVEVVQKDPFLLTRRRIALKAVLEVMSNLHIENVSESLPRYVKWRRLPTKEEIEDCVHYLTRWKPPEDSRKLLRQWPSLTCVPRPDMERVVASLEDAFGPETAAVMLTKHTPLLGCKAASVQATAVELMIAFGEERARQLARRHPPLVGIAWGSLRKKLDYLLLEMGRSFEEIVRCPTVLCRSLESCIKPRHEALGGDTKSIGLSNLLGCSRERFAVKFIEPRPAETEEQRRQREKWRQGREMENDAELKSFLGTAAAADLAKRNARVMSLAWPLVYAKLVYLTEEMGRQKEEIGQQPFALLRSLEDCIIPRHVVLGKEAEKHSLNSIYASPKWEFEQKFRVKLPHGSM